MSAPGRGPARTRAGDRGLARRRPAGTGEAELIGEFAFPLPIMVICELLGIPAGDRDRFRRWTAAAVSSPPGGDERPAALRGLHDYLFALVAAKRRAPGDDLVSALVADREPTEAEAVSMVFLLLIAGHETTVNLIGNGVLALLRHPDQLPLLRRRPELPAPAVEELLRYDGPVETATWRFAAEPVRIGGTLIAAGEPVLVSLAAADRAAAPLAPQPHRARPVRAPGRAREAADLVQEEVC